MSRRLTMTLAVILLVVSVSGGRIAAVENNLGWSTYLGGTGDDYGYGLAVDGAGYVYLAGEANSIDFPTTSGAWDTLRNNYDAFVTKLDPTGSSLIYSTYLGGTSTDYGEDLALAEDLGVVVAGYTFSDDFPVTAGAADTSHNDNRDVFVARLNTAGDALDWATYLGGSEHDIGYAVALDSSEQVYVTGVTESDDFPTTSGALDRSYGGGYHGDAFVARFNATATHLDWATYLGGDDDDFGMDIAVDGSGHAYVTGYTESDDFPATSGAFDQTRGQYYADAYVAKLSASGTALTYCTFLGGYGIDRGFAITVDGAGQAYVTGWTEAEDFPTTPAAWDTIQDGSRDAFVTALNAAGSALVLSTFLGGQNEEQGYDITLDPAGKIYVTGFTESDGFPTTADAVDNTYNGVADVFAARLSAAGSDLEYGTFLGGSHRDEANCIALDASGQIYLAGNTFSEDFPTTSGAFCDSNSGRWDVFAAKLGTGGEITFGSIEGTVSAAKGPIAGATVTAAGATTAASTTNSSGYYLIEDLPVGQYNITAAASGYASHTEEAMVTEDDTVTVDFFLTAYSGGSLVWSTYLGGTGDDYGYGLAVDGAGYVYLAGEANSIDFPTTSGAWDTLRNNYDAFVTKLDPTGSSLIYSTYLGGTSTDYGEDLALAEDLGVVVAGYTFSDDFPVTAGAADTSHNDNRDVFVARLNTAGDALDWATYLGGSEHDIGYAVALDSSEQVYVTGVTESDDFPTTSGALDRSYGGGYHGDAFVARFNATATHLDWATYLGGDDDDFGMDIAVDGSGHAYVTGYTESDDFPATSGAFDQTRGQYYADAYVAKLSASGTALTYCTFLGGYGIDRGFAITVDGAGQAYVTGWTEAEDFPTTPAAWDTIQDGSRDAFVTALNAAGSALVLSTFLGGQNEEQGYDITLDPAGKIYVTGFTESDGFPTTADAVDNTYNGVADVFAARLSAAGSDLEYGTFLGGSHRDEANCIALDASGQIYLAGNTFSEDFPTTSGAFCDSNSGRWDVFAAQINPFATSVEPVSSPSSLPAFFTLEQNYPNPFNPETTIRFSITRDTHVSVAIYNVTGQLVRSLTDEYHRAGSYELRWDGRDRRGLPLASGIYFCQLRSGQSAALKKMVLIR